MTSPHFSILILAGAFALGGVPEALGQSLLSNVSFNQQVFSTDRQTGTQYFAPTTFAGTSAPSSGSTSVTTPYGGLLNGQYSISDNGSTAVFTYRISYTLYDWDSVSLQGASGNTVPVYFTTDRTLSYSLSIENVITGHSGTESQLKNSVLLGGPGDSQFDITFNPVTGSSYTSTGTLVPHANYGLYVNLGAGMGSGLSFPASGFIQATQTVTLTLVSSAIPEPSTYGLLAGSAGIVAIFLVRRRQWFSRTKSAV